MDVREIARAVIRELITFSALIGFMALYWVILLMASRPKRSKKRKIPPNGNNRNS